METSYIRTMSNFPILVKTPLIFQIPWAPAPFPKRGVRALVRERLARPIIAPDKAAYCVFTHLLGPKNAIKLFSVRTKISALDKLLG